jgi:hypothetical protein
LTRERELSKFGCFKGAQVESNLEPLWLSLSSLIEIIESNVDREELRKQPDRCTILDCTPSLSAAKKMFAELSASFAKEIRLLQLVEHLIANYQLSFLVDYDIMPPIALE